MAAPKVKIVTSAGTFGLTMQNLLLGWIISTHVMREIMVKLVVQYGLLAEQGMPLRCILRLRRWFPICEDAWPGTIRQEQGVRFDGRGWAHCLKGGTIADWLLFGTPRRCYDWLQAQRDAGMTTVTNDLAQRNEPGQWLEWNATMQNHSRIADANDLRWVMNQVKATTTCRGARLILDTWHVQECPLLDDIAVTTELAAAGAIAAVHIQMKGRQLVEFMEGKTDIRALDHLEAVLRNRPHKEQPLIVVIEITALSFGKKGLFMWAFWSTWAAAMLQVKIRDQLARYIASLELAS